MAQRPNSRPWTRLIVLAVLIIGAYVGVFVPGYKPKLGIDLAGGTTVTLSPKSLDGGKKPSSDALTEAVDIIRNRVNGNGVSGATVVDQYPYIVVTVPASTSNRQQIIDTVSRTAQLYFREVATGCTSDSLVASGGDNCVLYDVGLLAQSEKATATKSATPKPSTSGTATPAPSASSTGAKVVSPTSTVSATPGQGASSIAPTTAAPTTAAAVSTASPTSTTHGRPLSEALAAATPSASAKTSAKASATATAKASASATPKASASATPAASGSATPAASGSATPAASGSAAPAASASAAAAATTSTGLGPLPAGTGMFKWTEAQARAAMDTLECSVQAQANRVADFDPTGWALGCGSKTSPYKYLLMPAGAKGTDVKTASAQPQQSASGTTSFTTGQWEVDLQFKNDNFYNLTKVTAGGTLQGAIVLDGQVVSAPTNTDAIPGDAQITGNFNEDTASTLANELKFGSLPLSFSNSPQTETISATLGKSSLHSGLIAGAIGIGIVLIYCFFYYRALGIVTILSLGISGAMVYASICLLGKGIGLTLSLPGIAGFIVAVGITADSFVVFYERIKDEVREGRRPRSAVESGWVAARRTIISADLVSILAAVVLYVVTIGDVRGFALTLGLSTVLDLVTVFMFTKPLVSILIQVPFFSSGKHSGLAAGRQAPLRQSNPSRPGAVEARAPGGPGRRPVTVAPDTDATAPADTVPETAAPITETKPTAPSAPTAPTGPGRRPVTPAADLPAAPAETPAEPAAPAPDVASDENTGPQEGTS